MYAYLYILFWNNLMCIMNEDWEIINIELHTVKFCLIKTKQATGCLKKCWFYSNCYLKVPLRNNNIIKNLIIFEIVYKYSYKIVLKTAKRHDF